ILFRLSREKLKGRFFLLLISIISVNHPNVNSSYTYTKHKQLYRYTPYTYRSRTRPYRPYKHSRLYFLYSPSFLSESLSNLNFGPESKYGGNYRERLRQRITFFSIYDSLPNPNPESNPPPYNIKFEIKNEIKNDFEIKLANLLGRRIELR